MGLGHFGGGLAVARWMARRGAVVTVTDVADETALADAMAELRNEPIAAWHLGGHQRKDFRDADLVVVNPAVRPNNSYLAIARRLATPLSSETELFLRACPAPVIGVTGSAGKSTTAAMTHAILRADGRRVWLGGNIGHSLLEDLERIRPQDWVVLELSSFQLRHLMLEVHMPRVAVVTNCFPNHLDWHGSYDRYVAAKQRILTGQTPDDLAVLGWKDTESGSWSRQVRGHLLTLVDEAAIPPLGVPGKHNRHNAVCAATAAAGVGCARESIRSALASFRALSQRLEPLETIAGRRFVNDSTATTPESTVAALQTVDGPVWLLAGGSDKGINLEPLAMAVIELARGAAFFGATGGVLRDRVAALAPDFPCTAVVTMGEALDWCWQRSSRGDCILLSPACASHDQFQNFRQRGEHFAELLGALYRRHRR